MKAGLRFLLFNLFLLISINIFPQSLWKEVFKQPKSNHLLNDIAFSDANTGIVVGQNGVILITTDGGDTWHNIQSNTNETLFSVAFADKNIAYACGTKGIIIKTNNGGATWERLNTGTNSYLLTIRALNNKIFAFGEKGLMIMSNDSGKNWHNIKKFCYRDKDIKEVILFNEQKGFFISSGKLYKTNLSIEECQNLHTDINLWSMYFVDTLNGFATNLIKNVYKTNDGGETWHNIFNREPPYKSFFNSIYAIDTNTVYVAMDGNGILNSFDGGKTWHFENFELGYNINKVYFVDKYNGFAIGHFGSKIIILRTQNTPNGMP